MTQEYVVTMFFDFYFFNFRNQLYIDLILKSMYNLKYGRSKY